jgi:hypothetical protein
MSNDNHKAFERKFIEPDRSVQTDSFTFTSEEAL